MTDRSTHLLHFGVESKRFNTQRPFAFAGLWDQSTAQDGKPLESCAILTTAPTASLALIHNRMPVIVDPADYDTWLDPALRDPTRLVTLFTPCPADAMVATPVGDHVNNPRMDDARCLETIPE